MAVPWQSWYLPMKFTIEVDSPRYPLTVLEVHSFPDEPRCVGVTVRSRGHGFDSRIVLSERLPLARWFNLGLRGAAKPLAYFTRSEVRAGPDPVLQAIFEGTPRKRGPHGLPDEHFELVAEVAKAHPKRPNLAVREQVPTSRGTPASRSTVQFWFRECRRRGLLPQLQVVTLELGQRVDDPELASYLRIEERELEAGGQNSA